MANYTFNGKALDEGVTGWSVVSEIYQPATSVGEYLPQLAVGKQALVVTSPWFYSPPKMRAVLTVNAAASMDDETWWEFQKFLAPMKGGVTLGTMVDTAAVAAPARLESFQVLGSAGAGKIFVVLCFAVDDYGMRSVAPVTEAAGAGKFAGSARPLTEALICFTAPQSGRSLGDWGSGRFLYWYGDVQGYGFLNIDTGRRLAFLSRKEFDFSDGVDASQGLLLEDDWMMLPDGAGKIGFSGVNARVRAYPYLR